MRGRAALLCMIAAVTGAFLAVRAEAGAGTELARETCGALSARVARVAGDGPVMLRSWETASGGPLEEPALATAAFTYDNALAAIALVACGRPVEAGRIGRALERAVAADRSYADGRLRNAYRAGTPPAEGPLLPPGWWDASEGRWVEDAYQVGTATGNVAWTALALLTLHEATGDRSYLEAATRALDWCLTATLKQRPSPTPTPGPPPPVFLGGFHGFEPTPTRLSWASTEHAVDLAAAFRWLARLTGQSRHGEGAAAAFDFLTQMWRAGEGRFLIGLLPDGTPNRTGGGVDAQLWPQLAFPAVTEWRRALDHVARAHAVQGGVDFDTDRDGLWVEGTAQAALTYRIVGIVSEADRLLSEVAKERSPGGLLFATRNERITTGLAIGPDSPSADFFYYRQGHVGATAWAALAALGWNPFTGNRVP